MKKIILLFTMLILTACGTTEKQAQKHVDEIQNSVEKSKNVVSVIQIEKAKISSTGADVPAWLLNTEKDITGLQNTLIGAGENYKLLYNQYTDCKKKINPVRNFLISGLIWLVLIIILRIAGGLILNTLFPGVAMRIKNVVNRNK